MSGLARRAGAAWDGRSRRERLLLGGLALGLGAYLVATLGAGPLIEGRAEARAAITDREAALARLAAAAPAAASAAAPAAASASERASAPGPQAVSAVLTETAPAFALAIRRIEPEGDGARLVLEDAEFAAVLLWLEALEREHAIRPVAVEMDRRPEPGIVTARLGLAR